MNSMESNTHRRSLLKGTLAIGGSTFFAPQLMFGSPGKAALGERVKFACCGIGNRGGDVVKALKIINHMLANQLLNGVSPRKDWE